MLQKFAKKLHKAGFDAQVRKYQTGCYYDGTEHGYYYDMLYVSPESRTGSSKSMEGRTSRMKYTFDDLAHIVAADFLQTMKERDFETFSEMARCYWWATQDIKDEVDEILKTETNHQAYIDDLDGTDIMLNGDSMPYRKFSAMFRRIIRDETKAPDDEQKEGD